MVHTGHIKPSTALEDIMTKTANRDSFAYETLTTLPKGTEIYTIVRHVSASGMQRVIDALIFVNGQPLYLRSLADEKDGNFTRHAKYDGFKINGVGQDMTAVLVMDIGALVHNDPDHFTNCSL